MNYVWWADLAEDDPWLAHVWRDYDKQSKDCHLFMGDLADLIRHSSDRDTEPIVEAWLSGTAAQASDAESRNPARPYGSSAREYSRQC